MRAYLRLDPQLADMKSAYPDGAFRAFVEVLCFAEQQHPRGVFRSRKLLAVLLEKRARWIPFLIAEGDLEEMPTGQLVVDKWTDWQEGDLTVPERMRRLRAKKRPVTPDDTPPVTAPVTASDTAQGVDTPSSGGGKPEAVSNSGGGSPREPTFMGYRPKNGEHAGQHANCMVCAPLRKPA